jgi:xanthosine utilization system XapX-like protein
VGLLVGTTLLYALTRLPYVAPAAMVVIGLTGAGAALSTRFGGRRLWTLDPLLEDSAE